MNLIFDFIPNYQNQISYFVQKINNVNIQTPPKIDKKKRQTQHFLISLISQEVNIQRKNLAEHAILSLGLKFQHKRESGTFNAAVKRKKKTYYPWMITGDLVSHLFY